MSKPQTRDTQAELLAAIEAAKLHRLTTIRIVGGPGGETLRFIDPETKRDLHLEARSVTLRCNADDGKRDNRLRCELDILGPQVSVDAELPGPVPLSWLPRSGDLQRAEAFIVSPAPELRRFPEHRLVAMREATNRLAQEFGLDEPTRLGIELCLQRATDREPATH